MITVRTKIEDRSFDGVILSYYGREQGNKLRPLFAVLGASQGQHRPLIENVRDGSVLEAERGYPEKFEFLKTAGYTFATQTAGGHSVTTIYLHNMVSVDPGVAEDTEVEFLCIPAQNQIKKEDPPFELPNIVPNDAHQDVVYLADLFCTMLGNRIVYPIPTSKLLRTYLFLKFIELRRLYNPWSNLRPLDSKGYGITDMGYYGTFHFSGDTVNIGEIISEAVQAVTNHYGSEVLWQD